ncbi:acetyl-CoA acetyltransferase [Oceanicola sp. 22II-s10i]|uniref:CaiB/BaiF CoA transferase family protein n=1 Tax=Oceanicola sp. 22II-s10i TaxID=1317116 RepID=UPI000B52831D|nr:CoA transferase [Oceanicola sp. 22II-s10i]OWU85893.1 acetyl-CoA acetyltransferase [Oceanicola sp. 22II-s10i]
MGPLEGLRVLDLSSILMGPYATQILGDYGAEVIKVEAPSGDLVRQIQPSRNPGMGAIFLNTNRSKDSIVLDLKTAEGNRALLRMAAECDVLLTNVRPRKMAALGLSWETLHQANPRLIYAALVGFDQRGPYAGRPAYDDLIQGGACIPYSFTRAGNAPAYVPAAIADRIVGMSAVNAILAAVVERDRSGQGQKVEVPMFETMVSMILGDHLGGLTYDPPLDNGGYRRHLSPDRKPYATRDGYVCALIYNDGHWERFFRAIGRPEMPAADPRYATFAARLAHIDEVYAELGEILKTRTTAEWLALFDEADVPAMPMHSYESVMSDPHLEAIGFFSRTEHPTEGPIRQMAVPAGFSRTPAVPEKAAPAMGAQGGEVLSRLGFGVDEIEGLAQSGALHLPRED